MKKFLVSAVLILIVVSITFAFGGRSGDKDATGSISQFTTTQAMCTVAGKVNNGSLWLGYTVYWKDGIQKDYSPVKVKKTFSKTLYYTARPQGVKKVTVCLWRYKVSKEQCKKERNGKACQYCLKNGFHMEGRIDCKTK